jgi:plastocyanin
VFGARRAFEQRGLLVKDSGPSGTSASEGTVIIRNYAFQPAELTVRIGTEVVFKNDESFTHNVRETAGAFSSGALRPGRSYKFTFKSPGTYHYKCDLHRNMSGIVRVIP